MSTTSRAHLRNPWRIAKFSRRECVDLVLVCLIGSVSESQIYNFLAELDYNMDWSNRTSTKVALLIDTTSLTDYPPNASEVIRAYMERNHDNFKKHAACTSIVVDGMLLRMFLRSLFYIQKPAGHVEVSSHIALALEHLGNEYNVVMPDATSLEALAIQLDRVDCDTASDEVYDGDTA